jgi:hypothetical protein
MGAKILLDCIVCRQTAPPSPIFVTDVRDEGSYDVRCPKGHRVAVQLSNPRFELVFEAGLFALMAGFYSETIADFYAALEGFHLFFVNVVCRHLAIDPALLEPLRKTIKLSERRYGAFCLAHLLLTKQAVVDDQEMVNLRNMTIHDGVIRTREEAMNYGRFVFERITSGLHAVRTLANSAMVAELTAYSDSRPIADPVPGLLVMSSRLQTLVDAHPLVVPTYTFDEGVTARERDHAALMQAWANATPLPTPPPRPPPKKKKAKK